MGPFFCTKNEKIDFEENKFNERFGECVYLKKIFMERTLMLFYRGF